MQRTAMAASAACAVLLGACGVVGNAPPATYDLLAPRVMTATSPNPAAFQLLVNEPKAIRSLETDRILVKPTPEQITYYKGAVWSDRVPRLLQARIVEAFQNAGLVRAVGSRGDRLDADVELSTEVRAFQVEVDGNSAAAHVSLYVKLVTGRTGRIVASRGFEAEVDTNADDAAAMVSSLNKAFDTVLRELLPWAARNRQSAADA